MGGGQPWGSPIRYPPWLTHILLFNAVVKVSTSVQEKNGMASKSSSFLMYMEPDESMPTISSARGWMA